MHAECVDHGGYGVVCGDEISVVGHISLGRCQSTGYVVTSLSLDQGFRVTDSLVDSGQAYRCF